MARIARRRLLQFSGAGAVAASTGGIAAILAAERAPAYAQGTTVRWLRWADFVPASDQLLRSQIAPECEKALGIKLTLEMINANDIQARITSAVQSGNGPDIILVVNNWPQLYADSVADVSDVVEEIGKAQGGFHDVSRLVANDGKKWIGVPWTVGGGLLTNRRSWFADVGYSDGKFPETWEEYRAAGKKPHLRRCTCVLVPLSVVLGRQGSRGGWQDRRAQQQGNDRVGQVRGRLLE